VLSSREFVFDHSAQFLVFCLLTYRTILTICLKLLHIRLYFDIDAKTWNARTSS